MNGVRPSSHQISSGAPMVNSAPGTGPKEPARSLVQAVYPCGTMSPCTRVASPVRMMFAHRVATIGWKRSTVTMNPLTAPIAAPMPRQIATTPSGEVIPLGSRSATITMSTRFSAGPIEMSIPPPPDRIAGVLAIAATASGAK